MSQIWANFGRLRYRNIRAHTTLTCEHIKVHDSKRQGIQPVKQTCITLETFDGHLVALHPGGILRYGLTVVRSVRRRAAAAQEPALLAAAVWYSCVITVQLRHDWYSCVITAIICPKRAFREKVRY